MEAEISASRVIVLCAQAEITASRVQRVNGATFFLGDYREHTADTWSTFLGASRGRFLSHDLRFKSDLSLHNEAFTFPIG